MNGSTEFTDVYWIFPVTRDRFSCLGFEGDFALHRKFFCCRTGSASQNTGGSLRK